MFSLILKLCLRILICVAVHFTWVGGFRNEFIDFKLYLKLKKISNIKIKIVSDIVYFIGKIAYKLEVFHKYKVFYIFIVV